MGFLGMGALALGGYATYKNIEQQKDAAKEQKESLKRQEVAQQEATNRAQQQQRMSEEAMRKSIRKTPDVNRILKDQGIAQQSTLLTGPSGISSMGPMQKNTLLGS